MVKARERGSTFWGMVIFIALFLIFVYMWYAEGQTKDEANRRPCSNRLMLLNRSCSGDKTRQTRAMVAIRAPFVMSPPITMSAPIASVAMPAAVMMIWALV